MASCIPPLKGRNRTALILLSFTQSICCHALKILVMLKSLQFLCFRNRVVCWFSSPVFVILQHSTHYGWSWCCCPTGSCCWRFSRGTLRCWSKRAPADVGGILFFHLSYSFWLATRASQFQDHAFWCRRRQSNMSHGTCGSRSTAPLFMKNKILWAPAHPSGGQNKEP